MNLHRMRLSEKRPILEGYILYASIYITFLNGKIIGVKSRLVSGCQESGRRRGQKGAGCGSLKCPCGDVAVRCYSCINIDTDCDTVLRFSRKG